MKPATSVRPLAALGVLLAVSLLPRLATLRQVTLPSGEITYYHLEGDELVFRTLVEQVQGSFFNYSLRGTPLLAQLNKQNYDLPIFFHPPAFVYTTVLLGFLPVPLVPVLMNLGTVALVFFIARRLYDDERALWAAFLAAVCPVMWFLSQKIWLDNMVILTTTASVAAALWAAEQGREWAYAVAGAVLGLAILTKVTAVLICLPVAAFLWQRDAGGITLSKAAAFVLPAALLAGWWELTLHAFNNQWLPSAFPNPEMIAQFPFVAAIVARPWYFYLVNLIATTPIYLLALDALRRRQPRDLALGLWFIAFWGAMTIFGLQGGGYQTRYISPGYPALALLAAEPIPRLKTAGLLVVMALVGYGMCNALLYAVLQTPTLADYQGSVAWVVVRTLREIPVLH